MAMRPGGEETSRCMGGRQGVERPEEGREGGELESRLTGILLPRPPRPSSTPAREEKKMSWTEVELPAFRTEPPEPPPVRTEPPELPPDLKILDSILIYTCTFRHSY